MTNFPNTMAGYSSLRGQRQLPGTRGKLVKSALKKSFGGSEDRRMAGWEDRVQSTAISQTMKPKAADDG